MSKTQFTEEFGKKLEELRKSNPKRKREATTAITKAECTEIVDTLIATLIDSLLQGKDVSFPGCGTFKHEVRGARVGRNPQSGATLHIPAKNVVKFNVSPKLKEAIANNTSKHKSAGKKTAEHHGKKK